MSEGCYLLRSNVTDWSAEDLWRAYIQLTEAEAALRIHKSDLELRPVWHHKQGRVEAAGGTGRGTRKVFGELQQIALVDVVMPTRQGVTIRKRCISRPTDHQAILL